MGKRAEADRTFRRVLWAGLAVSAVAHGALLAFGHLSIPGFGASEATELQLVSLPNELEPDSPLEVLNVRPAEATSSRSGGAEAAASAALARLPSLNAVLTAAIPSPGAIMDLIDLPDEEEPVAVTYAAAGGFGASNSPASSYRSIDGRSVSVLAAIGGEIGRGGGGHYCPPGVLF